MIGNDLGNTYFADLLVNDIPLDWERIRFNNQEKVDKSLVKEALIKRPSYSIRECMPKKVSVKCIRHLPATVGILLGILLRLPTYWVLQLGELLSLVFYIMVCNKALRLIPFKKEILEMIMILPMCIHQAASISYDAVLLPLCFLLLSYFLYLRFNDEKKVDLKSFLVITILIMVITIIKLPYVLLGAIIFIIPLEKVRINLGNQRFLEIPSSRKNYIIAICITLTGGIFVLFVLRNYEYVRILLASVWEWMRTLHLFKVTLETFNRHLLVSMVGNFGWLDTPMPLLYVCIVVSTIMVMSFSDINDGEETDLCGVQYRLSKWNKCVLTFVVLSLIYIVTLSMVKHTAGKVLYGSEKIKIQLNYREILYQIPYIGGLQGRYYIPMLFPILIQLPNILKISTSNYNKIINIIECAGIISTSHILLGRYW